MKISPMTLFKSVVVTPAFRNPRKILNVPFIYCVAIKPQRDLKPIKQLRIPSRKGTQK